LQQLVGIKVFIYYGAVLWQAVGLSEADALLINVFSGVVSQLRYHHQFPHHVGEYRPCGNLFFVCLVRRLLGYLCVEIH